MIVQIKSHGNSKVVVLPTTFLKFHDLKENDWVDISDIVKIQKEAKHDN
tara:strand:+ start:316 stop:462 length:147 start_codon:yes stop_codon:yes gene_type:complete